MLKISATFFVVLPFLASALTHYNGHKLYKLHIENEDQLNTLSQLKSNQYVDFWSKIRKHFEIYVMVDGIWVENFESVLIEHKINFQNVADNVEDVLEKERQLNLKASSKKPKGSISFDRYYRYDEITDYLFQLEYYYPFLVTLENVGQSYEGRDMWMVKISPEKNGTKPAILIDAGIHAREWIAPASALYIIYQLVENATITNMTDNVDWYIIPVMNPDGYEYSHVEDRMWRKTRSAGVECVGVDGNRNYDYQWSLVGASDDECSPIYHGPNPFSENETSNLRDFVFRNTPQIKVALSFHSYGPYLIRPWGYTPDLPPNIEEINAVGNLMKNAIENYSGTYYNFGGTFNNASAVSGSSDDWMKGGAGIPLAYTFELPGGGTTGFDLPPSRIVPVVDELWQAMEALHDYVEDLA